VLKCVKNDELSHLGAGMSEGTNYFDFDASVNAKLTTRQDKAVMLLAQGLSRPEVK